MYGSYTQINTVSVYILSLQVMVTHSSDPATEQAISDLNSKVKLIVENIAQLRHQLNDIVSTVTLRHYTVLSDNHQLPLSVGSFIILTS
jgi:hypothetical protein